MRIVVSLDDAALGAGPVADPAGAVGLGAALRDLDPADELVLVYGTPRDATTGAATLGVWLAGLFGSGAGRRVPAVVLLRAVGDEGDPDDHATLVESAAVADVLDGGGTPVCAAAVVVHAPPGRAPALTPTGTSWDPHRTAAELAVAVGADRLVLLTDVEGVVDSDRAAVVRAVDDEHLAATGFEPDTAGRAVRAAVRFARATGRHAVIGPVDRLVEVVGGTLGTEVTTASHEPSDRDAALAAAWGEHR